MKYELQTEIKAVIKMDDETFNLIWDNCKRHYSYDCKSIVEQGGFLYGCKGRREHSKKHNPVIQDIAEEVDATERQLGLLVKSLELDTSPLARKVTTELYCIVADLQNTWSSIANDLKARYNQ